MYDTNRFTGGAVGDGIPALVAKSLRDTLDRLANEYPDALILPAECATGGVPPSIRVIMPGYFGSTSWLLGAKEIKIVGFDYANQQNSS